MTDPFNVFTIASLVVTASFAVLPLQTFPANQTKAAVVTAGTDDSDESTSIPPAAATAESGGVKMDANATDESGNSNIDSPESARLVAATVLGRPIYEDRFDQTASNIKRITKSDRSLLSLKAERLLADVAGKLMMDFYQREELHPTEAEISAKLSSVMQAYPELAFTIMMNKQARLDLGVRFAFAGGSSIDWVVAKHLHEKYGGSVSVSSFGAMMSIEGRNALIRDYVARGDVRFYLPELEQALWEQAEKKYALDTTVRDQKRVKEMFETPPWERSIAQLKRIALEFDPDKYTLDESAGKSEQIVTLVRLPFPEDPRWAIAETKVSARDDIEKLGAAACMDHALIEMRPDDDKQDALERAREITKDRKLPLYLLSIDKQGNPETLQAIEVSAGVKGDDK